MTPEEKHNYRKGRRRQLYRRKRLLEQGWKEVTSEESSKVMDDLRRQRICYNFCTSRELQRLYGADNITHVMGIGWFKKGRRLKNPPNQREFHGGLAA